MATSSDVLYSHKQQTTVFVDIPSITATNSRPRMQFLFIDSSGGHLMVLSFVSSRVRTALVCVSGCVRYDGSI